MLLSVVYVRSGMSLPVSPGVLCLHREGFGERERRR